MNADQLIQFIPYINNSEQVHKMFKSISNHYILSSRDKKKLIKVTVKALVKLNMSEKSLNSTINDIVKYGNLLLVKAFREYYKIPEYYFNDLATTAIKYNRFRILEYLYHNNCYYCVRCDLNKSILLGNSEMIRFLDDFEDIGQICSNCAMQEGINFVKTLNAKTDSDANVRNTHPYYLNK